MPSCFVWAVIGAGVLVGGAGPQHEWLQGLAMTVTGALFMGLVSSVADTLVRHRSVLDGAAHLIG